MTTQDLEALNDQFGIHDYLAFVAGPGDGLPLAEIRSKHAAALVAVNGAQVARYQPHGAEPLLFVSRESVYGPGKSIRGGIPVCWPWFAAHPSDPSKPFHGFARTRMWQVRGSAVLEDDQVQLRLGLADDDATREIWPYAFDLELVATIGAKLRVELVARNTGEAPSTVGGALHTYFLVGDVARIAIEGLDGCAYIDKVDGGARSVQAGPVTIAGEVDRIYLDTADACVIDDPALGRRVRVAKVGSNTTVVWNPWVAKAAAMPDFGDGEWPQMLCIETANTGDDGITLAPGAVHAMTATIRLG